MPEENGRERNELSIKNCRIEFKHDYMSTKLLIEECADISLYVETDRVDGRLTILDSHIRIAGNFRWRSLYFELVYREGVLIITCAEPATSILVYVDRLNEVELMPQESWSKMGTRENKLHMTRVVNGTEEELMADWSRQHHNQVRDSLGLPPHPVPDRPTPADFLRLASAPFMQESYADLYETRPFAENEYDALRDALIGPHLKAPKGDPTPPKPETIGNIKPMNQRRRFNLGGIPSERKDKPTD